MFSIFLKSASFLGFPSLFGKSVTVSLVLLAYCDFFWDRTQLWEMKMMQCGALSDVERSSLRKNAAPITPVHDLNVPYEGPAEEYETPTAEMLFPPVRAPLCLFA